MSAQKINSIQALRAFAVVSVVFVHSFSSHTGILSTFYQLSHWGAIGVDLFFVISGFIMTMILPAYTRNNNSKTFILKRLIRVLPMYWLVSFFIGLVNFKNGTLTFPTFFKSVLLFPVFDKKEIIFAVIPQGWTLSYELYFYLVIYLILLSTVGQKLKVIFITLLISASVGYFNHADLSILRFFTSPLLYEFALGITVGIIYFYVRDFPHNIASLKKYSVALVIIGTCCMLATIVTGFGNIYLAEYVTSENATALQRIVLWGIPSAIFVLGIVLSELAYQYNIPKIFIKIGDASYSCYLIHFFIAQKINAHFNATIAKHPDMSVFAIVLIIVALSLLVYKYIEKPLIKWLTLKLL